VIAAKKDGRSKDTIMKLLASGVKVAGKLPENVSRTQMRVRSGTLFLNKKLCGYLISLST